jgi:site-specific DNA-cytosine methylase
MLDYVAKHKPTIVILENVSSAPWAQVVDKFAGIGYNATSVRLDTKQHYIPHTRVRGYLIAVPASKAKGSLCDKWADKVISLRRPASVTLEAFLLADDDPRIQRARQDLATIRQNKDGVRRAPTDWNKCESRHSRARDEEMLGQQRPCTAWVDGGGQPTMPDGAWNDWAAAQTERVTDLMDISSLRLALTNVDVRKSPLFSPVYSY